MFQHVSGSLLARNNSVAVSLITINFIKNKLYRLYSISCYIVVLAGISLIYQLFFNRDPTSKEADSITVTGDDTSGELNETIEIKQPDLALSMSISSAIQQHIMQKLSPTATVLPPNSAPTEQTIAEEPLPSEEIDPVPSEEIDPLPSEEIDPLPSEEIYPLPSDEIYPVPSDEIGPLPSKEIGPLPSEEIDPAGRFRTCLTFDIGSHKQIPEATVLDLNTQQLINQS